MTARTAHPHAAEALHALAARDAALPDLLLVLDDDRRAEALGFPTTVERLRYKRGASVVAALRTGAGELLWLVSYSDRVKVDKSLHHVEQTGGTAIVLSPATVAGPVRADRRLARVVRQVFGTDASRFAEADVVRYNPHRRLVLRDRGRALKLADPAAVPFAAAALAGQGHPVLAPQRVLDGAWAYPWWGDGDLASRPDPAQLRRAGGALARLHAASVAGLRLPLLEPTEIARTAASAVATLLPSVADRAHRLADRLAGLRPVTPPVFCHGDWSADQVLTDGREIRIIDLDRAALAPGEYDLGSYLACGGDPALLEGYRAAGGSIDVRALDGWRSLAQLRRATEPFRTAHAHWPAEIERALTAAERGWS